MICNACGACGHGSNNCDRCASLIILMKFLTTTNQAKQDKSWLTTSSQQMKRRLISFLKALHDYSMILPYHPLCMPTSMQIFSICFLTQPMNPMHPISWTTQLNQKIKISDGYPGQMPSPLSALQI